MQSLRRAIPDSRTVPQKEDATTPAHDTACATQKRVRHIDIIVPPEVGAGQGKSLEGDPESAAPPSGETTHHGVSRDSRGRRAGAHFGGAAMAANCAPASDGVASGTSTASTMSCAASTVASLRGEAGASRKRTLPTHA